MDYENRIKSAKQQKSSAQFYGAVAGFMFGFSSLTGTNYFRAGNIIEASTSYVIAGLMRRARKDAKNWERDQTKTIERIVQDSRNHRVLEFHGLN